MAGSTSAGGGTRVDTGGSTIGGTAGGAISGTGGNVTGGTGGRSTGGGATGGTTSAGGAAGSGGKNSSVGTSTGGSSGAGGSTSAGGAGGGKTGVTFTVTSPGWENKAGCSATASSSCATLPAAMTRSGAGTSPELTWTGAPEATKSFVVILQDLTNNTTHWVLWNIPATVTTLAANVDRTTATPATPAGSQQCGKGTDPATDNGYYGPGAPCDVYELTVYALSVQKFSPTNATDPVNVRTQLNALGDSILGKTTILGRTNTGC